MNTFVAECLSLLERGGEYDGDLSNVETVIDRMKEFLGGNRHAVKPKTKPFDVEYWIGKLVDADYDDGNHPVLMEMIQQMRDSIE
jgi:hypothetical protein